jgi:hypothetical protein
MQQTYGPLTLDLPNGWEEETLIVLKGPAAGGARESLVVRRVPVDARASLDMLADLEEDSLRQSVGTLSVFGKMDLNVGGFRAVLREVGFAGQVGPIRQVQVALLAGKTFLVFAGSALDNGGFAAMRERVMRLVSGAELVLDGPGPVRRSAAPAAKAPAKKKAAPKKSAKGGAKGGAKTAAKTAAKKTATKKPAKRAAKKRH